MDMKMVYAAIANLDSLLNLEELVERSAYVRAVELEYQELGVDVPEKLADAGVVIRKAIANRTHAADLARLKAIDSNLDSLKTANQRKEELLAEQEFIKQRLGMGSRRAAPAKVGR
jgi:hypothetical protein